MIYSLQNIIPKELIAKIKSDVTDELLCKLSDPLGAYNRTGKSINISKTPELTSLDAELYDFICKLSTDFVNFRYRPMFKTGDSGYEFHRYGPEDICLVHGDGEVAFAGQENTALLRYATVVLHLNTVKNGGKTIFPNQNKSFDTVEGQVLIFPPYHAYQHYVTPSDEQRDIVMTWMVYNGITVSKAI